MMSTRLELDILAPARISDDAGVELMIYHGPTPELHRELSMLGYTQFGYSDERLGFLRSLSKAVAVAEAHGNPVHQKKLIGGKRPLTLIGEPLDHARVYEPTAAGARVLRRPEAKASTNIVQFQGDWAVWVPVTIEVTF